MFVTGFPAGMFQTNCYIVGADAGESGDGTGTECVVIDPGQDAAAPLTEFLDSRGMTPRAVLLTHGHLDHMWSAQPVADKYSIPTLIHPDDRFMLTDPARGIGPTLQPFLEGATFVEPADVVELSHDDEVEFGGLRFRVLHTPGHTQGSVVFDTSPVDGSDPARVLFSGDTLFEGSIGRTDLPGGDHRQLLDSIATRLLPLDDTLPVLPGHGNATTIGRERTANPFLQGA